MQSKWRVQVKGKEVFSNEMDERKFIHNLQQERKTQVVKMESASKGRGSLRNKKQCEVLK